MRIARRSSPIVTSRVAVTPPGNDCGTGNINADPLFVDPGNGDYHLGPDSPCIDVGNNDAPDLPDYDFEGDVRILDGDGDGGPSWIWEWMRRSGPASTCRWC